MSETRRGHSHLGIASFVISVVPAVLFAVLVLMVLLLSSIIPAEAGWGMLLIFMALMVALSELVALALGIAGALQRQRKRTFAFLGIACSILVLVVGYAQDVVLPVWM